MSFNPSDLNKWFTRVRKRIAGPPGFVKQNSRAYWNHDREVARGIGITSFKFPMPGTMHVGFAAWVVLDFDMKNHWYRPYVNTDHVGFVIEQYAGPELGLGEPTFGSDRIFIISQDNCDQYEDIFVKMYETQIGPWLDGFDSSTSVFELIQSTFPYNVVLPLKYDRKNKDATRVEVGQSFLDAPDRQDDRYIEWLEQNGIVTPAECIAIKKASMQARGHCIERIMSIGAKMVAST